jgi:hypothetical protein
MSRAAGLATRLRIGRRDPGARRGALTAGGVLATAGRVVLWVALAVLLIRGLDDVLSSDRAASTPSPRRGAAVSDWPDDAAKAFAIGFVDAYLNWSPGQDPDSYARGLETFAAPELVADLAPRFDEPGHTAAQRPRPPQGVTVRSATVAGAVRLDDRRALVTVAATLAGATPARRVVTVPIARDTAGGLVVYDLPSFASGPRRAAIESVGREPLIGPDRDPILDVVTRFLRAYLAGDSAGLAYLVPSGTRLVAAAGRWELVNVTALGGAERTRDGRLALATVEARDAQTGASYTLRYRLELVRRDRWYVAQVNGPVGRER